ncbi:MAG: DNA recombination/repair protein RecA [Chloroflexota bacterium]|nr:DNA recombination/repair protein RecA [Chloroflexota bacterium]
MVGADPVPTGQPGLDAALRTGGWPRGALALLDAPAGGGATSLALGSLAACQADGGLVAWLDPFGRFDPATAVRLGASLEWMLVVRPNDPAEAVELAGWLARTRLIDLLVLDLADVQPPRGLDRLADLLLRAGGTGLLLAGRPGRESAGRVAGVRVELARRAWLAVGQDLVGQRVEATVTRHRWALAGGRAELDLWFGEGRRIDPLLRSAASPFEVPAGGALDEQPALRVISA